MKTIMLMAVSLLSVNIACIAKAGSVPKIKKEKALSTGSTPFNTIVINGDVDVVLFEADDKTYETMGTNVNGEGLSFHVKKGILYVNRIGWPNKKKPVAHIPVKHLQMIEVNGRSNIRSNGFLQSDILKVQINEESNFDLKNRGKILFEKDRAIELHFENWKGAQLTSHINQFRN